MPTQLELLLSQLMGSAGPGLPSPAKPLPVPVARYEPQPLSNDTSAAFAAQNLEPVPPGFVQPAPIDNGFVDRYAGAAPVAPVQRDPSFLDKLSTVLLGVGAGIAGNGPQFVESVRRQREEPFRRYEAQRADYDQRRGRGIELAERRAEREADALNRAAENRYERDFKVWLQRVGVRDAQAQERLRQTFELEKQARAIRAEQAKELQREQRQREVDARQITQRYFTVSKNMGLSKELGRYYAGLSDSLSPAAAKLDAAVQGVGQARMGRAAGGNVSRGGLSNAAAKALANFEAAKQQVITARQSGDVRAERQARQRWAATLGQLSRFPREIETGGADTEWPYAKARNAPSFAAPAQPAAKTISRAEMQALGITEAEAQAEGFTVVP